MSDLIPFILHDEKCRLKEELMGKDVGVIFDGTSRFGEALVVVLRFMDFHSWSLQQRLVRVQLLAKTMCGDEIARELISILSTELGIAGAKVLACMRDQASTNNVAMRTIDVGEHFVKATYSLEGDGALVFTCIEVLSTVDASCWPPA